MALAPAKNLRMDMEEVAATTVVMWSNLVASLGVCICADEYEICYGDGTGQMQQKLNAGHYLL